MPGGGDLQQDTVTDVVATLAFFPPHPQLPDLAPAVDDLFLQISRAD